jgi:hypothetical protein
VSTGAYGLMLYASLRTTNSIGCISLPKGQACIGTLSAAHSIEENSRSFIKSDNLILSDYTLTTLKGQSESFLSIYSQPELPQSTWLGVPRTCFIHKDFAFVQGTYSLTTSLAYKQVNATRQ